MRDLCRGSLALRRTAPTARPTTAPTPSPATKSPPPTLGPVAVGARLIRGGRGAGGWRGWGAGGLGVRAGAAATPSASASRPVVLLWTLLSLSLLLSACLGARRLALASELLLELLQLPLHELLRDRLLLEADRIVSAVRAAPPSFGISLVAGRAEDALGQRHS